MHLLFSISDKLRSTSSVRRLGNAVFLVGGAHDGGEVLDRGQDAPHDRHRRDAVVVVDQSLHSGWSAALLADPAGAAAHPLVSPVEHEVKPVILRLDRVLDIEEIDVSQCEGFLLDTLPDALELTDVGLVARLDNAVAGTPYRAPSPLGTPSKNAPPRRIALGANGQRDRDRVLRVQS